MKPKLGSKLADKLMDLANFTAGTLVIGQLISGRPFNWTIAGLGLESGLPFTALPSCYTIGWVITDVAIDRHARGDRGRRCDHGRYRDSTRAAGAP